MTLSIMAVSEIEYTSAFDFECCLLSSTEVFNLNVPSSVPAVHRITWSVLIVFYYTPSYMGGLTFSVIIVGNCYLAALVIKLKAWNMVFKNWFFVEHTDKSPRTTTFLALDTGDV